MSASNASLYQSANSSTSTLRPRGARLISYTDDEAEDDVARATSTSTASSRSIFPSQRSTPAVSRSTSVKHSQENATTGSTRPVSTPAPLNGNDLWSSWSNIASSFLGNEGPPGQKSKSNVNGAHRPPKWMKQDRSFNFSTETSSWGPRAENMPPSSQSALEDRRLLLEAKKREALLIASVAQGRDAIGRYKRRDSDAALAYPASETEDDALVYIHQIQHQDTLAGVMLKYGCQPDVFRKVNRFWPNDNIQTRKHVLLPVESCSVRGKKVDPPQPPDLLSRVTPDPESALKNPMDEANCISGTATSPIDSSFSSISLNDAEQPVKPDSYVLLPNFTTPTAILRLPRRSLGYFPRARRKSQSQSHFVSRSTTSSTTSTPKTSFDLLRHPPTHAAQQALSLSASPARLSTNGNRPDSLRQLNRSRSSSISTTATLGPQPFSSYLSGPGGVGTLRGLRTEPSRPGPGDDTLSKKFAQYLPSVAPPDEAFAFARNFGASQPSLLLGPPLRTRTPRASTDSVRSQRSNSSGLGELGGAVEGFMRKLATGNSKGGGGRKGKGPGGGAADHRMGDLIELETTSNSDFGDLEERRRETEDWLGDDVQTPTMLAPTGDKVAKSEEELLNERFPVRGRIRSAYNSKDD